MSYLHHVYTYIVIIVLTVKNFTLQDEIRIAKMIQSETGEKKFSGLLPSWHHVDCFLDALADLDAEGVSVEELSGFVKMKKEDKDELKEKFEAKTGGSAKAG